MHDRGSVFYYCQVFGNYFSKTFLFFNFSYAINIHDMSEAFTVEKSKVKVRLTMSY